MTGSSSVSRSDAGGSAFRSDGVRALPSLAAELVHALDVGASDLQRVASLSPRDERDELLTLAQIHSLWFAPIDLLHGRERHQSNPDVVRLKGRLEASFLRRIGERPGADEPGDRLGASAGGGASGSDVVGGSRGRRTVEAVRRIAAIDLVPPVYGWVAAEATWEQFLAFLALEGGPDAGFDDLVALAQVGISGAPKVALATNYWDELGRGDLEAVHTNLHHRLLAATDLAALDSVDLPVPAIERATLGSVLVTNRCLQPELIGALGLLELQAGPRCRAVLKALDRLGAPPEARLFYEEHALADPRHGKDWLDRVVAPLATEARWAEGITRGARWRQVVNHRFFSYMHERFVTAR